MAIDTEPFVSLGKRVAFRFVRGFAAGAVSAMALVTFADAGTWAELANALTNLTFAFISGGLTGGAMALDKWVRELKKKK